MNLFDISAPNYFSIFSGKNKNIYMDSLMILYSFIQNEDVVIKKSDFLSALKDKEKFLNSLDIEDEDLTKEEKENINEGTTQVKASFILNRLIETSWINVVMDIDSYEEIIVLPPYTISILKTFNDIVSDEESPYISLVHSTYSELKLEDEEQDDLLYATLLRSYENTKKLKIELITLSHSIKIFQNRLTKLFETNDVLFHYFDIYKKKISDRYYHPLKTFDSVAKYKRPIIKILTRWLDDKDIRNKLILQASISAKSINKSDIENEIITKINYITDTYESINKLISSVDKENNLYTKASTQKILYLNNSDKTIKGHLENIFKHYASKINEHKELAKILTSMQDSFSFYEEGYIDSDSITLPLLKKYKEKGEPMEIFTSYSDDTMMDSFIEETKNMYNDERIFDYMLKSFGKKNKITSKDFYINNFESLILFMLASVKYNDESNFYNVEINLENKEVINGDYLIPDFTYIKKEENK